MEVKHRNAITGNLINLIKVKNFESICEDLISCGVYSQDMLEEVLIGNGHVSKLEMTQRLFLNLRTRGPTAFSQLIRVLKDTGNRDLANELMTSCSSAAGHKDEICRRSSQNLPELEDEVDSSCSTSFAEFQFNKSQKSGAEHFEVIDELPEKSTTTGKPPASVVEIVEITVPTALENEQVSVQPQRCFSSVSEQSTKYIVKRATVRYNGFRNEGEYYNMKSTPRGLALIVNNIDFRGDPDAKRIGAEKDSDNLKSVLEQMGYEVTVATDVMKMELLDRESGILANFIKKFSEKNVDSCIVSINSHGFDRDWIRMSDPPGRDDKSTAIDLFADILQRFNNRNFPIFKGRPKLFLVNACRGSNHNRVVLPLQNLNRTHFDGSVPKHARTESEFSDFFILRSTVPEYVSIRDLDLGTWFIQCICKAFSLHAFDQEFQVLKRKVSHFMEEFVDNSVKQSCHYEEIGTTKSLYFNPGL